MTFDTRARGAAQGIHRAVDVMEMSSTKTPQKIARFDQYRERTSRINRFAAIAVGIGVPLLLLAGALRFLWSDAPAHPMGSPTSVSPTPVTGRSEKFEAPFTYGLPPGWTVAGEGVRWFALAPADAPGEWGSFYVLSNVVAARSDCSDRPQPGVGHSSAAITDRLATHPALDTTTPQAVTLGAATGSWVDVQLADDWPRSCAEPNGLPLLTGRPDGTESWAIYWAHGHQKIRFYVLDLPTGDTVTIVIAVNDGSAFSEMIDQAAPVVQSLEFQA